MGRRAAITLLFVFLPVIAAQTPPPEFIAASVKPVPLGSPYGGMQGGPGSSSPGQIDYHATTLRAVVATAYGVQRVQIVGPAWFDNERYDIAAKIPAGTNMEQFRLMLQRMLTDRFRLEMHKENRTAVIYEMRIAKTGLKMKPSTAADTEAPAESQLMETYSGGKLGLRGQRVTMRQLLVRLTRETDRPIIDMTGLTGTYDFVLPWTPRNEAPAADDGPAEGPVGETIYTAVEKFLGLSLTARKEPVGMLVIDRLERVPTEN